MIRPPTQTDVAQRAGVSTATVSRVLNNPRSVRPPVRAWVENAIDELGYLPHGPARALASSRSRTIGAVIPTVNNEIFAAAINALEECLSNRGYTLVLSVSNYDLGAEAIQVRRLIERGIDGLVLVGNDHAAETYRLIETARVHHVSVLSYDPDSSRPNIGIANRDGGWRAADHLIGLGHTRIGMVCGLMAQNDRARGRYEGFCDGLTQAGLSPFRNAVLEKPYTIEAGREALAELVDAGRLPTALVCGNDVLALGVMLEAQRRGLHVPRDLSITGFDDLPLARHFLPSLTTIAVPVAEAGRLAGVAIVESIEEDSPIKSLRLAAPLLVRGSTAPPSGAEEAPRTGTGPRSPRIAGKGRA